MKFAKTYRSSNNVSQIDTSLVTVEDIIDFIKRLKLSNLPDRVALKF